MSGLPFAFDNGHELSFEDINTFKKVEIIDMLESHRAETLYTHFAYMYLLVIDPYTREVMIGAEIRQEVILTNDTNVKSVKK